MSGGTIKILRSVKAQPERCFFCYTLLMPPTSRNCRNMFKTDVFPLERKASDLIGELLDVPMVEDEVHSRFMCLKCFQLVSEFAELEARAGEIRTDMFTSYQSAKEAFEATKRGEVGSDEDETSQEGKSPTLKLDAEKLNQLVAEASGGSLKIKGGASGEGHKFVVVNNGEYKEFSLANILEEEGEEEEVEENEEPEESKISGALDVTKIINDQHVCQLCPDGDGNVPFSSDLTQMNLMKYHFQHEHNARYMFCDICGSAFLNKPSLMAHVETHNNNDDEVEMTCEQCNRSFTSLRLYRIHKRQHTGVPKAWSCEICGKKYSSRNLLEEHMNSHLGVKPYNCDTCGKSFSSKYTYKAHQKIHSERERNYNCSICEKSFMTFQNLTQHLKTHTESKDHVCDICGKGFGSLRNLEVHSVVHSGLKPYVCRFCSKAFARKAEIKDHERTHTGEKPFVCEHCGSQFSQRSNLQSHKRVTHFNDRRYVCDNCGKGFKRKRLLDYHVKAVHTGERPYSCTTCDATFVYPEHYKKHIRIHTGIKPFKCEVCDKAFNSRDNRNAHRFVHSDKKPYECLVCGIGFMRKPLLYSHMQQAGHVNDTIVVNQPRLEKPDDDQSVDQELLIVDESNLRKIMNKQKVYLTDSNEHVILQEDEKGILTKLEEGNIKTLTNADGTKQLLDDEGNLIDLDQNMISIEMPVDDDDDTMMAHINERGELVDEDGQVITEDGQTIIVENTMVDDDDDSGHVRIKSESNVQYVQIEVPEGENPREWLKMVKTETE